MMILKNESLKNMGKLCDLVGVIFLPGRIRCPGGPGYTRFSGGFFSHDKKCVLQVRLVHHGGSDQD